MLGAEAKVPKAIMKLKKYSSQLILLRTTACALWRKGRRDGPLIGNELSDAERCWIGRVHRETFRQEVKSLQDGKKTD